MQTKINALEAQIKQLEEKNATDNNESGNTDRNTLNAPIENLKTKLTEFESKLAQVPEDQKANFQAQIESLKAQITVLEANKVTADINELKALIATLDASINELKAEAEFSQKADEYADKLYEAMDGISTDTNQLRLIINNEGITDDQFVVIIKRFEEKYGVIKDKSNSAFIQQLSDEGGMYGTVKSTEEKELMSKIAERLANAANNGNLSALDIISKEVFASINGIGTIDRFLVPLFDKATDETILKVNAQYSNANNGRTETMFDDINSDYYFPIKDEQKMLDKVKKVLGQTPQQ